MDRNTACRFAIRIPGYEEHGTHVYHVTCDKNWVRDKDTISWMDFYADLNVEIKRGSNQSLSVSFWDKVACKYMDIDSDSSLLAAIDMYWDIRKLPLVVSVINQPSHENKSATDLTIVDMKTSQLLIYPIENKSAVVTSVASNTEERPTNYLAYDIEEMPTNYLAYDTEERTADDPWGENDEIEYVGVDDEPVEPSSNTGFDYIPDTDEEDNDDCIVDDEKGCEVVEHITDLENPKIAVGVTFEDRETF